MTLAWGPREPPPAVLTRRQDPLRRGGRPRDTPVAQVGALVRSAYNRDMSREEAIAALRGYLPAIRRDFGVRRIALFGSTARGDAREDSDLDILVDFEKDPTFLSFMGLKAFLEDHLGHKVDLVTPDALKPRMRPILEREAVDVAQG